MKQRSKGPCHFHFLAPASALLGSLYRFKALPAPSARTLAIWTCLTAPTTGAGRLRLPEF